MPRMAGRILGVLSIPMIVVFNYLLNRRLSDLIRDAPSLTVDRNEPSLLRGQYRGVILRKHA
jgi:hypothetical protein